MSVVLEVKNLQIAFGGVKAVDGLSFAAREKEIIAVIGPNGAGKDQRVQLHHRLLQADQRFHRAERQ